MTALDLLLLRYRARKPSSEQFRMPCGQRTSPDAHQFNIAHDVIFRTTARPVDEVG